MIFNINFASQYTDTQIAHDQLVGQNIDVHILSCCPHETRIIFPHEIFFWHNLKYYSCIILIGLFEMRCFLKRKLTKINSMGNFLQEYMHPNGPKIDPTIRYYTHKNIQHNQIVFLFLGLS